MSFWVCPVCPALSLRPSVLYNIETTQPLELSRCTDRRVFRASHWCSFLGGENGAGGEMGQQLRCWMCKAPQGPHWRGASGRESCRAYFYGQHEDPSANSFTSYRWTCLFANPKPELPGFGYLLCLFYSGQSCTNVPYKRGCAAHTRHGCSARASRPVGESMSTKAHVLPTAAPGILSWWLKQPLNLFIPVYFPVACLHLFLGRVLKKQSQQHANAKFVGTC